ncbi:hypothetical protein NQ314_009236 [Rhamnusium bicolor]|uniref:YqaJ viral recombinase domain-containing protein n=1 Tax=Rhamnusium bicolor TaxID=1586634 RepID=A0AAV8Y3K1_9CUCU|nr:hypothetical protein NQ314_009236 [Rhamnusium bicolor]
MAVMLSIKDIRDLDITPFFQKKMHENCYEEEYGNHGDKISFLKEKLSLTKDRIVEVQKLTVGQTNNPAWYIARKHRLTASNFGQVLKAYKRGRFPPTLFQTLTGASPDGIIDDDTLIEVKCPFKYKDSFFSDCLLEIKDYIVSFNGESFILNDAHNYYHQIQGQLHICGKKTCILALWTTKDYLEIEVVKNVDWQTNLNILQDFYLNKYIQYITE